MTYCVTFNTETYIAWDGKDNTRASELVISYSEYREPVLIEIHSVQNFTLHKRFSLKLEMLTKLLREVLLINQCDVGEHVFILTFLILIICPQLD